MVRRIKSRRRVSRSSKLRRRRPPKVRGKIRDGWVEARVYMPKTYHDFLKQAATARKLSLSQYIMGRIGEGPEIVVHGDLVAAPPPLSKEAAANTPGYFADASAAGFEQTREED